MTKPLKYWHCAGSMLTTIEEGEHKAAKFLKPIEVENLERWFKANPDHPDRADFDAAQSERQKFRAVLNFA